MKRSAYPYHTQSPRERETPTYFEHMRGVRERPAADVIEWTGEHVTLEGDTASIEHRSTSK